MARPRRQEAGWRRPRSRRPRGRLEPLPRPHRHSCATGPTMTTRGKSPRTAAPTAPSACTSASTRAKSFVKPGSCTPPSWRRPTPTAAPAMPTSSSSWFAASTPPWPPPSASTAAAATPPSSARPSSSSAASPATPRAASSAPRSSGSTLLPQPHRRRRRPRALLARRRARRRRRRGARRRRRCAA